MAVFSAAASIFGASKQAKAAKNAAEAQIIAAREAQGIANVITDPGDAGAIPVTSSGTCALGTPGGAQTRTVAIPTFAGQLLGLSFDVDGGDCVVTFAQAINQASNTVATAADTGDHLLLQGVTIGGALRWRVVANDGWALS